jgi:hypothetical protein
MAEAPKNDRDNAVTRFCLSLEEFRRTDEGRVRDAKALVQHFFPYDAEKVDDRLFPLIPKEVRGKVLAGWGIRGLKSALRDDDDRVRMTVHDALVAGDIDEATFEEGLTAEVLVDWVSLSDWWSFWRGKTLPLPAVRRALAFGRELRLFDDRWFLLHVEGRGGKLIGTDAICDTLSKETVIAWLRAIHASGDGSPTGIVAALGWEKILSTTSHEALLFALDALAREVGLVPTNPDADPDATTAPRLPSGAPPAPDTPVAAPAVPEPPRGPALAAPPPPPRPRPSSIPAPPRPSVPTRSSAPPSGAQNEDSLIPIPESIPPEDNLDDPERPTDLPSPGVLEELFSPDDLPSPPSDRLPRAGPTGFVKEESWWPERAEPGDMGWDLAYGVSRPMAPPVRPSYGFGENDADEPTSEIQLPEQKT